MSKISAVAGDVLVSDLGNTLMHEHVVVASTEFMKFYPKLAGIGQREENVASAIKMLQRAKDSGMDSLLDCTVFLHGRDIEFVKEVADAVDINIMMSTGIYTYDYLPFFISMRGSSRPETDVLTRMFVHDLTRGIGGSKIRAVAIKVSVDSPGITANIKRVLKAAGRASAETGAPVTVHIQPGLTPLSEVLTVLDDQGCSPERVIFSHIGDSNDIELYREAVLLGANLGCDRFGLYTMPNTASESERVTILKKLADEGWADRIVLSHDSVIASDWNDEFNPRPTNESWGPHYIGETLLPLLDKEGVHSLHVREMLINTPRRLLANGS